ncbi:MAG: MarC family protein [Gammaproteobacteria bacterium]
MNIYTAAITLILVMDPLGNVPMFLAILNRVDAKRRRHVILRECVFALIVLALFLFFGKYILEGMQISEPALSIAGGMILFIIAIKMIFPRADESYIGQYSEPFIVPLAIPLVAGPSSMAIVILLSKQWPHHIFSAFSALFVAWLVTSVILFFGDFLRGILGQRGLTAIERLMGMILTTISVQMFLNGVSSYFHLT